MAWKDHLLFLEHSKRWDAAITYMQNVIAESPNDADAYISMIYLFMNLLVEEDYDAAQYDYYVFLATKYFNDSYIKFSSHAEYLFFTGIIASIGSWHFGIEDENILLNMKKRAVELDKDNILYKWGYSPDLKTYDDLGWKKLATLILKDKISRAVLESQGAAGRYLLDQMIQAGENNKEKLCWRIDLYFSDQRYISAFCYSCDKYFAKGLEGDELNTQEVKLFFKFMQQVKTFVEFEKKIGEYPKFDFPIEKFNEVAWQLREALKNDGEENSGDIFL